MTNLPTIYRRFGGIYRCRLCTSGLDFDSMPEDRKRVINNLPALLYHDLPRRSFRAKAGVLMRMNAVPRSTAVTLAEQYSAIVKEDADLHSVRYARSYLRGPLLENWQRSEPTHVKMTGERYREIWSLLAGERLRRRGGA